MESSRSGRAFLLSGIPDEDRTDLARKIHILGGTYFDIQVNMRKTVKINASDCFYASFVMIFLICICLGFVLFFCTSLVILVQDFFKTISESF